MNGQNKLTITGIAFALLLIAGLTIFFGANHNLTASSETSFWISRLAFWGVLILIYLYSIKIEKTKFLLWHEQKRKPLFYLASIIIIIIGITILLTGISLIEKKAGLTNNNQTLNRLLDFLCTEKLLLIFTCLTAAFVEEFIFRGYLLPRLELLTKNKWMAIFLSALLFGLAHFGYGDLNRVLFPFIIGLIFAFYYSKYRSLTVLIICHFLIDLYSTYGACKA